MARQVCSQSLVVTRCAEGLDILIREIRGIVTYAGKLGVLLMALLFVLMLIHRAIANRFLIARLPA